MQITYQSYSISICCSCYCWIDKLPNNVRSLHQLKSVILVVVDDTDDDDHVPRLYPSTENLQPNLFEIHQNMQ